MDRRLFDLTLAAFAAVALSPLLALAFIGIKLASPGPVLFRARRVGRGGREFTLYKFRTMHRDAGLGAPITSAEDSRVFRFGKWLRDAKLDELPQLFNVIKGDMAIVGPRPEDPTIVRQHYTAENVRTLDVLPGLASPGSIFNYTHGQQTLVGDDATASYVNNLLPIKLALDGVYVERASVFYDLRIIARTLRILLSRAAGKRNFPEPPEFNVLQSRLDNGRWTRWPDRKR